MSARNNMNRQPFFIKRFSKNLQWFIGHLNFILYFPKRIFENYLYKFATTFFGRPSIFKKKLFNKSNIDHNWELFFKVEKGDIVINVGAWPGLFISSIAHRSFKIVAIEAEPSNFKELKEKLKVFSNVIVINKAVWNCRKKMPFYIRKFRGSHSLFPHVNAREIMVEADTLDNIISDLNLRRVDFLTMDIEGAELEALEGAKKLLSKIPKIAVAAYHVRNSEKTLKKVDGILIKNGFITWINMDGVVYGYKTI